MAFTSAPAASSVGTMCQFPQIAAICRGVKPSAAGLGREAAEGGSTEEGTDSGDSAGQEVAQGVGPKGVGARESEGGVQDGGDGSRRGRDAKRART